MDVKSNGHCAVASLSQLYVISSNFWLFFALLSSLTAQL